MKVYIAGPLTTSGDIALNMRAAITAAEGILDRGHLPYIPHLTFFWHFASPHPYDYWIKLDKRWLMECDALLRLPGESRGTEIEVSLAARMGLSIYHSVEELHHISDNARESPDRT